MTFMLYYSISRRFMLSSLTRSVTISSQLYLLYLSLFIIPLRLTSRTIISTLHLTTKVASTRMTWNLMSIRADWAVRLRQMHQLPLTPPSPPHYRHILVIRLTTLVSRNLHLRIFPCRHLTRQPCSLPAPFTAQHSHRLEMVSQMWQMPPMHSMVTRATPTTHPQCLALFLPHIPAMIFIHLSHLSVNRVVPTAASLLP
jgi:hypothetical protein